MSLDSYIVSLENACAATLLYAGGPMTAAKLEQWKALTGTTEVTPEQLVNFVRRALERLPNVPEAPARIPL